MVKRGEEGWRGYGVRQSGGVTQDPLGKATQMFTDSIFKVKLNTHAVESSIYAPSSSTCLASELRYGWCAF